MLNKYSSERVEIDTNTIFNEKITVNSTISLNNEEILKIDEMSIKNYFTDYENGNNNSNLKVKYNDNGEVISFYSVSSTEQYIELLSINSFKLYSDSDYNMVNVLDEDINKFFKENKIENDIDFLNYIKNNYYLENNIFSSVKTMKNNYLVNTFVQVTFPEFKNIILIDGVIDGYIFNMKNDIREIHIMNRNKTYTIVLSGDEITNDEFISQLLQSVNF